MDKKDKKKDEVSLADKVQELNEFADFVVLSFDRDELIEDPIIEYMQKLRSHFHIKNPHAFRARFLKGYQVLLEEVSTFE